jgi:predicted Ser/Thr protein kinase
MGESEVTPDQQEAINDIILVLKEKGFTFKEAALILHLVRNKLDNMSLYSHL